LRGCTARTTRAAHSHSGPVSGSEIGGGPPHDSSIRVDAVAASREAIGDAATDGPIALGREMDAEEVIERSLES